MTDLDKLKQLRKDTDVSYSMCKKALDDAKGDIDKALEILKKKGVEVAKKKAGRETDQGAIFSYIHHNKKIGSIVELLCETDYVAINKEFQKLGDDIAIHIASTHPKDSKELLDSPFIKNPKTTIDELIKKQILTLGENITVGSFERYEI